MEATATSMLTRGEEGRADKEKKSLCESRSLRIPPIPLIIVDNNEQSSKL